MISTEKIRARRCLRILARVNRQGFNKAQLKLLVKFNPDMLDVLQQFKAQGLTSVNKQKQVFYLTDKGRKVCESLFDYLPVKFGSAGVKTSQVSYWVKCVLLVNDPAVSYPVVKTEYIKDLDGSTTLDADERLEAYDWRVAKEYDRQLGIKHEDEILFEPDQPIENNLKLNFAEIFS